MKYLKRIYHALLPERARIKLSWLLIRIRGWFYRGSTVTCNCCGKSYTKFLPFGRIPRPNAECPGCHSLERHRLLMFYLEQETDFFRENLKVLHFAPELMLEKLFKRQNNLDYLSCDLNPALAMRKVDIMDIDLPDNTFDYIICLHVLIHVPDEEKALKELYRILKPGGSLILQTKITETLEKTFQATGADTDEKRTALHGQPDWFRTHGKDFPERVASFGFQVHTHNYIEKFSPQQIEKYGLGTGEAIYHCLKR